MPLTQKFLQNFASLLYKNQTTKLNQVKLQDTYLSKKKNQKLKISEIKLE